MYKVGDNLTLIKEKQGDYTLGNAYKILKIKGNMCYLQNDNSFNSFKEWGVWIWNKEQLDIYFKNLRDERLKKLKNLNEL